MVLWLLACIVLSNVGREKALKVRDGPIVESPPEQFVLRGQIFSPFVTRSKEALVHFLLLKCAISIHSLLWPIEPLHLCLLQLFWLRKSIIEHVLIIGD